MQNVLKIIIILVSVAFFPLLALADTAIANQDLQRAINELAAAKVYIQQAREQSPANQRVVFHYAWVLSDIDKISGGIEQKFNMPRIQPRDISSLQGDYLVVIGEGK